MVNLLIWKKRKFYHVYFDDNKEKIKRYFLISNENVTKLKKIIDYHAKTFAHLFEEFKCIEYIILPK